LPVPAGEVFADSVPAFGASAGSVRLLAKVAFDSETGPAFLRSLDSGRGELASGEASGFDEFDLEA
jgi:hypothetical protein